MIKLTRVHEEPSSQDGLRVQVERLWPRGLTTERGRGFVPEGRDPEPGVTRVVRP
jgi:hypothetical protein